MDGGRTLASRRLSRPPRRRDGARSCAPRRERVRQRFSATTFVKDRAAFDELRQGIRDIEFIGDEQAGELRIGCPESITAGFLLPILQRLTSIYPRLLFEVRQVEQPTIDYPELRDRKVDLALARWGDDPSAATTESDLETEILLNDPFCLVVSQNSK